MPIKPSFLCRGLGFAALTAAVAATAHPARAALLTVTTTADSGLGSLRRAINEANKTAESDRIQFVLPASQKVNGVWTITPLTALPGITTPVRITGPGSQLLTIRPATGTSYGCLSMAQAPNPKLPAASELFVLSGVTLRDAGSGGGLTTSSIKLKLQDCRILNNKGGYGGGIYAALTEMTMDNCLVQNNTASQAAGLYLRVGSTATITNSRFIGNKCTSPGFAFSSGGAIAIEGNITAQNCVFSGNVAAGGSAVSLNDYLYPYSGSVIGPSVGSFTDCTFDGNSQLAGTEEPQYNGGTLKVEGSNLTLQRCTISNNSTSVGSAIYQERSNVTIGRSVINNNTATDTAAIYVEDGTLNLFNSTLASNQSKAGVGIKQYGYTTSGPGTTLVNCTLYRNGPDVGDGAEISVVTGTASLLNTIVHPVTGNLAFSRYSGTIKSLGNNLSSESGEGYLSAPGDKINTVPRFDSAGLKDNGGPTKTIALLSTSPAINAGSDVVLNAPYSFGTDQRPGFARKVGPKVDIGAFEYQSVTAASAAASANAF